MLGDGDERGHDGKGLVTLTVTARSLHAVGPAVWRVTLVRRVLTGQNCQDAGLLEEAEVRPEDTPGVCVIQIVDLRVGDRVEATAMKFT